MVAVVFVSASVEVKSAVSELLARKMGEVLAAHPRGDLESETICGERLHAAGYSSTMIFHLGVEARAHASVILAGREWPVTTSDVSIAHNVVLA